MTCQVTDGYSSSWKTDVVNTPVNVPVGNTVTWPMLRPLEPVDGSSVLLTPTPMNALFGTPVLEM